MILWLASMLWLKELDGPLDGVVFGGVVGLGFTLTEDVLYLASAMTEQGFGAFGAVFVIRTVLAGLGHATFTAVTGLGIGLAVESRHLFLKIGLPLLGWGGAIFLHSVHNFLVTFLFAEGLGLLVKLLLFWLIDALFFALLVGLVIRDRSIVRGELLDEVGRALSARELSQMTSWWMLLPGWNWLNLLSTPVGYSRCRRKQLTLVELAFLKHRQRRGESGLEERERSLRETIASAADAGVFLA
jgi:hypothetical protein